MFIIESDRTLFVDVDDTLIIWDNAHATYRPHLPHVDLIKKFHTRNQPVIVWSAGGYEWALKIVQELDLGNYVAAVMSKPAWFVDDLPSSEFLPEVNRIYLPENPPEPPKTVAAKFRRFSIVPSVATQCAEGRAK